jgi:hypothetical protein
MLRTLVHIRWGPDKFPKETPLVFYRGGKPIEPPLGIHDGLKVVRRSMSSYIEREVPRKILKMWRTQSPRHFIGGDWNQNGSCVFDRLLEDHEVPFQRSNCLDSNYAFKILAADYFEQNPCARSWTLGLIRVLGE